MGANNYFESEDAMRSVFCKSSIAIAMVLILIFAVAYAVGASSEYFPGIRVGTGNLSVTNGTFAVKDSNSVTKFSIAPATGNTAIAGTLAVTGASTLTGNTAVTGTFGVTGATSLGTLAAYKVNLATDATGAVSVVAADTGKTFISTKADGATTYTLPDPSAATVGLVFRFVQTVDQNLVVVPTTANGNSIVADGVATSDKVSCETASHKIGASILVVGISATKWLALADSGATLTVEAAD